MDDLKPFVKYPAVVRGILFPTSLLKVNSYVFTDNWYSVPKVPICSTLMNYSTVELTSMTGSGLSYTVWSDIDQDRM